MWTIELANKDGTYTEVAKAKGPDLAMRKLRAIELERHQRKRLLLDGYVVRTCIGAKEEISK